MTTSLKVVLCLLSIVPFLSAQLQEDSGQKLPWQPHTFTTIPGFPIPYTFPYNPAYFWNLLSQYNAAINSQINNAASNTAAATLAAIAAAQGYAAQGAAIAAAQGYAAQFPYQTLNTLYRDPATAQ